MSQGNQSPPRVKATNAATTTTALGDECHTGGRERTESKQPRSEQHGEREQHKGFDRWRKAMQPIVSQKVEHLRGVDLDRRHEQLATPRGNGLRNSSRRSVNPPVIGRAPMKTILPRKNSSPTAAGSRACV